MPVNVCTLNQYCCLTTRLKSIVSMGFCVFVYLCVSLCVYDPDNFVNVCFLCSEVKIRKSRKGTRKQSILQDVAQRIRVFIYHTPIKKKKHALPNFTLKQITTTTEIHFSPTHKNIHKDIYFCLPRMNKEHTHTHTHHFITLTFPSPLCQKKCSNVSNIRVEGLAMRKTSKATLLK